MCLFLYLYAWQLAMYLIKWKQLTAKNALKNTAKCNTFTVVHAKSPNKSLQNLNCIGQSTISRYIIQLQSFDEVNLPKEKIDQGQNPCKVDILSLRL